MYIKHFPLNSKRAYVIFEDNDKIEYLESFMKQNNTFRLMLSSVYGYKKPILPFKEELDFVAEIAIQYTNINKFTQLYYLRNVKKISLEENPTLISCFDIRKLSYIEDFSTDNPTNIEGLFDHPNLINLHIEPKKIKQITIEEDNHILKQLSISNSHVNDISELSRLIGLKSLSLEYLPKINNIDFILDMNMLINIEICSCKNLDNLINILSKKINLEELTLWNQGDIDTIIPLKELKQLTTLNIWEKTKILDGKISFLKNMKKLKTIDIKQYKHYDI